MEDLFLDVNGRLNFSVNTVPFPSDKAIIEVWTSPEYLGDAIKAGYDGILAYGWYLDRQVPIDNETSWFWMNTWRFMYLNDPEGTLQNRKLRHRRLLKQPTKMQTFLKTPQGNILRGEASMWAGKLIQRVLTVEYGPGHALWQSVCGLRRICVMWKKRLSG